MDVFTKSHYYIVKTLVTFYIGKLEDLETIIPALKGLFSLSKLSPFTSTDAVEVLRA
jgi:DNA repair/transcription protein MET18/MMS19